MEVTRGIGFRFDLDDYHKMYIACCAAAHFMKSYGKGRESYEIDLSHYEQGTNKSNCGSVPTEPNTEYADVLPTTSRRVP